MRMVLMMTQIRAKATLYCCRLGRRAPISSVWPTKKNCAAFSGGVSYDRIELGDHGPYQEFSVIHTDRSLNLMSPPFQTIMRDLHSLLKDTYAAEHAVIIPGCVMSFRRITYFFVNNNLLYNTFSLSLT
jgi:hypothetical protein